MMNAYLVFAPLLALVAFLSTEVTADTFSTYTDLAEAGFVNGFDYQWTVNVEPSFTISTTGDAEGCLVSESVGCAVTPATWDNSDTLSISATLPDDTTGLFTEGATPTTIEFKMCFSKPSTGNRKWRAYNDPFAKDNSCKNGGTFKTDWVAGEVSGDITLKSVTPTALMTVRAEVMCDVDGNEEICHIVNRIDSSEAADQFGEGRLYFTTEVMDSRPNNLFVAVIICAFIGPVLLAAFLIYERGILAKQA